MTESWINFGIVILVQLLIFGVHAAYEKRLWDALHCLWQGVLFGIPAGLVCDLFCGKLLGLFSYELGFTSLFLIVNAALSYGIFAANALLMKRARLLHFYIWSVLVMAGYEAGNYIFRVWTWEFSLSPVLFFAALSAAYFLGALLVVRAAHILSRLHARMSA